MFTKVDLLATPAVAALAKTIGQDEIDGQHYRPVLSWFSALVNHMACPAIALPLVGVTSPACFPPQLVAPWWREDRLLGVSCLDRGRRAGGFQTSSPFSFGVITPLSLHFIQKGPRYPLYWSSRAAPISSLKSSIQENEENQWRPRPQSSPRPRRQKRVTDKIVIRFAGDSGDGMQVAGSRFTDASAYFGNDLSTLPSFPGRDPRPGRHPSRVSPRSRCKSPTTTSSPPAMPPTAWWR